LEGNDDRLVLGKEILDRYIYCTTPSITFNYDSKLSIESIVARILDYNDASKDIFDPFEKDVKMILTDKFTDFVNSVRD